MSPIEPSLRSRRFWLVLVAIWSVPVAIGSVVFYVRQLQEGEPRSWLEILLFVGPFWYLWAFATPLVLWLGSRWPLDGPRVWRNVALHLPAALVTGAVHLLAALALMRSLAYEPPSRPFLESYRYFVAAYLEFEFLLYWAILGVGYLLHYYTSYRANALRTAQLETQLAQAHLEALKVQLQPHFLFNTLHSISALMDEDLDQARRMLVRLGDLLRATLETQGTQEVPLQQELECTELYLDIERVRFPEQLDVELLVEPEAVNALVPSLILQPLVENAIRHGIAPREDGGKVTIDARCKNGRLVLQVIDDGTGLSRDTGDTTTLSGVGMANVRARLTELYGSEQGFRVLHPEWGGFAVEIVVPYRLASASEPEPATTG